jgi:formylglycine-generating enzyme
VGNIADATAKAVFPLWPRFAKSSDGYVYTSPVGKFLPNSFGLYDMLGNASEWCSDWHDKDYYQHSPPADPQGPDSGTMHISRGGSFTDVPGCRYRFFGAMVYRRPDWGFRVVRAVADSSDHAAR